MIHPIRLYGDPVLRRRAAPIERFDAELARLADDMIETMHDAHGVGLAGPQIGVPLRVFVAAELDEPEDAELDGAGDGVAAQVELTPEATADHGAGPPAPGEDHADEDAGDRVLAVHVMINAEITERSGERIAPDGCLSVPGLWVQDMRRDAEVVVRYQDLGGAWHERRAVGHFAHVIQHELDHLDGVLYFDRLDPDERRRFLEAHRSELADMQRQAKAFLKEHKQAGAAVR